MLKNVVLIQIVIAMLVIMAPGCGVSGQNSGDSKQAGELKDQLNKKQDELSNARKDFQSARNKITDLENQLANLRNNPDLSQATNLKNELTDAKSKLSNAEQRIKNLIKDASSSPNDAIANDLKVQLKTAQDENLLIKNKITELEAALQAAQEKSATDDERIKTMTAQLKTASSGNEAKILAEHLETAKAKAESAQKQVIVLEKSLREREKSISEFEREKILSSSEIERIKKEKEDTDKKIRTMNQKMQEENREKERLARDVEYITKEKEKLQYSTFVSKIITDAQLDNKLDSYSIVKALDSKYITPKDEQKIIDVLAKNRNKNETAEVFTSLSSYARAADLPKVKAKLIKSLVNMGGVDNEADAETLLTAGTLLSAGLAKLRGGRGYDYSILDQGILPENFDEKGLYTQIKYASIDDTILLLERIVDQNSLNQKMLDMLTFLVNNTKNPPDSAAKNKALYKLMKTEALANSLDLAIKAMNVLMSNGATLPENIQPSELAVNNLVLYAYGNPRIGDENRKTIQGILKTAKYSPISGKAIKEFVKGELFLADKTNPKFIFDIYEKIKTDENTEMVLKACVVNAFYYLKTSTERLAVSAMSEDAQAKLSLYQNAIKELLAAVPEAKEALFSAARSKKGGMKILNQNMKGLGLSNKDFE